MNIEPWWVHIIKVLLFLLFLFGDILQAKERDRYEYYRTNYT